MKKPEACIDDASGFFRLGYLNTPTLKCSFQLPCFYISIYNELYCQQIVTIIIKYARELTEKCIC